MKTVLYGDVCKLLGLKLGDSINTEAGPGVWCGYRLVEYRDSQENKTYWREHSVRLKENGVVISLIDEHIMGVK